MSREQRTRQLSEKALANKKMAEDKAYIDYQEMARKTEKKITKFGDEASSADVFKSLTDLEVIKRRLDKAYTGLQTVALSTISSRCERRNGKLIADINEMKNRLTNCIAREHKGPDHERKEEMDSTRPCQTRIKLRKSEKALSMKSLPTYLPGDVHHTLPRELHDEDDYRSCAAESEQCESLESYSCAASLASDSTVEDYLKNNCDHDYLPDKQADISKVNMIELAKLMNESLNASRLPIPEPTIFTGNPLEYPSWKCAFETLIESKSIQPAHRIHYLKKYLGGEAKAAVECTFYVNTDLNVAFNEAKETLDRRYGNPFLISEAIRDKLYKWPIIKPGDGLGLRAFADYLQQCNMAMKTVDGLSILNDCRENRRLLAKLPDCLIQRWSRIVSKESTSYPPFSRFALFITTEADIMCNPMLSNIKPHSPEQKLSERRAQSSARTMVTVTDESANETDKCEFCGKQFHAILECKLFAEKNHDERRKFIMSNGMCFSCLRRGHLSSTCPNRAICETCNGHHPTCLCGDFEKWSKTLISERTVDKEEESEKSKEDLTKATSFAVLNNKELDLTTMIVPVRVYSNTSNAWTTTYALQDSQSDSTFILDSVADELDLKLENIDLRLSTIISTTDITTRKVDGITISGINNYKKIFIKTAYTRNTLRVNRSHIPTTNTAAPWSHLHSLRDKIPELQNIEIGMLIGYNCTEAIKPISVISGAVDEPYGVETHIGWSIVGASQNDHENVDAITMKAPPNVMLGLSYTNTTRYAVPSFCKESNFLTSNIDELNLEPLHNRSQEHKPANIVTKQPKTNADNLLERPLLTFNTEHPKTHADELTPQLESEPCLSDNINASIDMNIEQNDAIKRLYDEHSIIQSPELLNSLITVPQGFQDDIDPEQTLTSYKLLTYKTNVVKPTFKDFILKKWCVVQGSKNSIWHRWKSLKALMLRNRRK